MVVHISLWKRKPVAERSTERQLPYKMTQCTIQADFHHDNMLC